jgi:hypothetical protein
MALEHSAIDYLGLTPLSAGVEGKALFIISCFDGVRLLQHVPFRLVLWQNGYDRLLNYCT